MEGPAALVLLATVRDFADRLGAQRVVVLLDRGGDLPPALIEALPDEPLTLEVGEEQHALGPADLVGVMPIPLARTRSLKPVPATAMELDPIKDEIEAPLGVIEALAAAVSELALAMGERSVAQAEFATRSGEPLAIAAREGEPAVLTAGERQYEL